MSNAWILEAVRSPRGRGKVGKGALAELHSQELLAQTLQQLVSRAGVDASEVDDVVIGCVAQVNEQGGNIARQAVLAAGWPVEVTGVTLNRVCGSGLQAINYAAMSVMTGVQQLAVGGGVENMARHPLGADGSGNDGNNVRLREKHHQVPQGISADLIATLYNFSRDEIDAFALRSQQNAAQSAPKSLVPIHDPDTGAILLDRDEFPRPDTTLAGLANLKPSFADRPDLDAIALKRYDKLSAIRHVHTAGNSSGIVDGAAAVLVASDDYIQRTGAKPRARIRAMATAGADPVIMLTAPAPASRKALRQAGMNAGDIDLWEINEAFAAVPLQTIAELSLDPSRVNVAGGAIALGHPLGATGAILLGTAIDELERRGLATALITLCTAGGQAVATIIERV